MLDRYETRLGSSNRPALSLALSLLVVIAFGAVMIGAGQTTTQAYDPVAHTDDWSRSAAQERTADGLPAEVSDSGRGGLMNVTGPSARLGGSA